MIAERLVQPPQPVSSEKLEAHYDVVTQFSELVDGSMRTSFELSFDGRELYGPDGRALGEVTQEALNDAKRIVRQSPELRFEVRRRSLEDEEVDLARKMARGELPNTMVIPSDFPAELNEATEDVGGYNVSRKQTMLRVLALKPDGNVQLYSQSLDGSDRASLEAIYSHFGQSAEPGELLGQRIHVDLSPEDQVNLVDNLMGVYDQTMAANHGGAWYAGRRPADYRNTYDFVCTQRDLVQECIRLRLDGQLNDSLMYDLAATMQDRFKLAKQDIRGFIPRLVEVPLELLHQEIKTAGAEARLRGESFSACGGILRGEEFDKSTESQMELSGYGNMMGEDKYGSRKFKCQKGHENTRPHNKLIEKCKTCGISVKC